MATQAHLDHSSTVSLPFDRPWRPSEGSHLLLDDLGGRSTMVVTQLSYNSTSRKSMLVHVLVVAPWLLQTIKNLDVRVDGFMAGLSSYLGNNVKHASKYPLVAALGISSVTKITLKLM
jgi:hypothetical protein